MRVLDWRRVLDEHRVPYVTSGANVKRGELALRCPWCGSADPSHHMGIDPETGWYSCWRNRAQHSGKSPLRLLIKLLGVTYAQARDIAGLGNDYVDPEGFDAAAARLLRHGFDARPGTVRKRTLQMDDRFEPITDRPRLRRFRAYLVGRGFSGASAAGEDVDVLCSLYGLHAGTHSQWADRVVIPYVMDGELVTWTARAISEATHRYWDLPLDESLVPPKETLFNHDAVLAGGKVLALVEGPLDALKVDFYGRAYGVRAVGLSTNSVSEAQAFLLQPAADRFERTLVMLDNASVTGIADSMRMRQALAFIPRLETAAVPFRAKDPGELRPRQVIEWACGL